MIQHTPKVVRVMPFGWGYLCPCGAVGKQGGYDSEEYAIAAARRHVRAMLKKKDGGKGGGGVR